MEYDAGIWSKIVKSYGVMRREKNEMSSKKWKKKTAEKKVKGNEKKKLEKRREKCTKLTMFSMNKEKRRIWIENMST